MSFFTATSPIRTPSAIGNVVQAACHGPTASHAYPFPAAAASSITGYNPYTAAPATSMQTRCLSNTPMTMARVKSQTCDPRSAVLPMTYKPARKTHDIPMRAGPSFTGANPTATAAAPMFNINPFEAVGMVPGGVTMEWGQDGGLRVVPQKVKYTGEGKQSAIKPSKAAHAPISISPAEPIMVSSSQLDTTSRNATDRRAHGSVPPIPTQVPVPDVRKGSLDASSKRRRPSFRIDIPAPPSAGSLLKGFRHSITPMRERASEPMVPIPSHSGSKLLSSRRDSKNNFVILDIKEPAQTASEIHGQEMHEVAEEYKAAKGMGMGYSLNRRVSTPWTHKESADWLEMNREDSMESVTEGSDLWALRNTMANARV